MTDQRSEHRILFVYPYASDPSDAVARAAHELAAELRREGARAHVAGLSQRQLRLEQGRLARSVRVMNQAFFYVWLFIRALSLPGRAHVVTIDVPSGVGLIARAARTLTRGRVRDVAWVMDLYRLGRPQGQAESLVGRCRRWIEAVSLRCASTVVVLGDCMGKKLDSLGVDSATAIPLWAAPMELAQLDDATPRPLRLLYSGSARDFHPLVDLIGAVAGQPGRVELRIFGRGSEIDRGAEQVARLGAANIVVGQPVSFVELATHYGWADLHVVSLAGSATGTCVPSKTYAAMGSGRAVLYLGDPHGQAAADVLKSGGGLVVDHDVVAIQKALSDLHSRMTDLGQMGEAAKKFVLEERTISGAVRAWKAILSS